MFSAKAFLAGLVGKFVTWAFHRGVGWVKTETPEYAMAGRRRTKERILAEKDLARATAGKADDVVPLGADVYFGLATMRQAQEKLGDIFTLTSQTQLAESPAAFSLAQQVAEIVTEAIRILDEGEDEADAEVTP